MNSKRVAERANVEGNDGNSKRKVRRYNDTYLEFGFTHVEVGGTDRPKCIICLKILSVESMLPSKLRRHLETQHPDMVGKGREFFESRLLSDEQEASTSSQTLVSSNALLASYKVAYRVAQCKKPHTIAEELILPAAIDLVSTMLGDEASQELRKVPVSNSTIRRRIDDMAGDINRQLVDLVKSREFALQVDEATDSNKDTHLICYVRFVNEGNFHEDLLFCKPVTGGTTGQELFNMTDSYMLDNGIPWDNCVGICTDGARAMSGWYSSLQTRIHDRAPNAVWTHCFSHREALAVECLNANISDVVSVAVKVISYIKTRPMKARLFAKLCVDMGADHSCLLFFSKARWLSFGNSLQRMFELRREIYEYLTEEGHGCASSFTDDKFVVKLGFLADLFEKLNILNRSLQGRETHILQLSDKIVAFKRKLQLWKNRLGRGDLSSFARLNSYLVTNNIALPKTLKRSFEVWMGKLLTSFNRYFPEDELQANMWVRNPFSSEVPEQLTSAEGEEYIDLTSDFGVKTKFNSTSLVEFWCWASTEYPQVSAKALRVLIPFATSYLCETGFSAVAAMKTKYRSRLDIENEMRVAISSLQPRFDLLCKGKQVHPSH